MPTTKRSDLIIPELLVEAIRGAFKGKDMLLGSGVAVISNTLPGGLRRGDKVKVPYFGTMGEMEDIDNEGDALTPEKLSESYEEATVKHSGKAFERTEWARLAAQEDPYPEAARQFAIIANRRVDKALVDAAGLGLPSTYINDVTGLAGALANFSWNNVIDTVGAFGDELEDMRLMIVHSKIYRDMLKMVDSTGRPLLVTSMSGDNVVVPRFMGIPVRVSDKCKKTDLGGGVFSYETIIGKEAALAFWYQEEPRVLTDVDALADSELAAIHMYWVAHRYQRVRGGTTPGILKLVSK